MKKIFKYILMPFYVIIELGLLPFMGIGIGARILSDKIEELFWKLDD